MNNILHRSISPNIIGVYGLQPINLLLGPSLEDNWAIGRARGSGYV
jgi:hypothetical protein